MAHFIFSPRTKRETFIKAALNQLNIKKSSKDIFEREECDSLLCQLYNQAARYHGMTYAMEIIADAKLRAGIPSVVCNRTFYRGI